MTKDEMAGWHHRLNGHEFEQTLQDSEGQGNLVCGSPWGSKSQHNLATEQQQQTEAGKSQLTCLKVKKPVSESRGWNPELMSLNLNYSTRQDRSCGCDTLFLLPHRWGLM